MVKTMLKKGATLKFVAKITGLSLQKIQELYKKSNKKFLFRRRAIFLFLLAQTYLFAYFHQNYSDFPSLVHKTVKGLVEMFFS